MEQERIEKLAEYLEEPVENFKEGYGENIVENTETGEEYFVGTYDESYEAARQDIEDVFDDLGLEAFTPWFQTWILDNAFDEDYFEDFLEEERDYFTNTEPDEESLKIIDQYEDNPIAYFKEYLFDEKTFNEMLKDAIKKDKDLLDMEVVVDKAIEEDGIAHFIARYDGEEIELDDDLFAYRID